MCSGPNDCITPRSSGGSPHSFATRREPAAAKHCTLPRAPSAVWGSGDRTRAQHRPALDVRAVRSSTTTRQCRQGGMCEGPFRVSAGTRGYACRLECSTAPERSNKYIVFVRSSRRNFLSGCCSLQSRIPNPFQVNYNMNIDKYKCPHLRP